MNNSENKENNNKKQIPKFMDLESYINLFVLHVDYGLGWIISCSSSDNFVIKFLNSNIKEISTEDFISNKIAFISKSRNEDILFKVFFEDVYWNVINKNQNNLKKELKISELSRSYTHKTDNSLK